MKQIDHIGIAVRNLDSAVSLFQKTYGAELIWRRVIVEQQMESAFIKIGDIYFELMMSTDPGGVIEKFVKQKGEGIHHISISVDDFENITKKLREQGMQIMGETCTDEYTLAFIHPKNNLGVLMEIIERKDQ